MSILLQEKKDKQQEVVQDLIHVEYYLLRGLRPIFFLKSQTMLSLTKFLLKTVNIQNT